MQNIQPAEMSFNVYREKANTIISFFFEQSHTKLTNACPYKLGKRQIKEKTYESLTLH